METAKLADLPIGELFRTSPSENGKVWIRGPYERLDNLKKYLCTNYDDHCDYKHMKGTAVVYIGFTY